MNIYLLLYATIIRTGCQLKTRFASPSDHDTPPPPIDSLLTHKLTSIIDTGERHRLNVAEADCNFCRKLPVDLLLSPSSTSEAIGCDSSLSVDMLLDLFFLFTQAYPHSHLLLYPLTSALSCLPNNHVEYRRLHNYGRCHFK